MADPTRPSPAAQWLDWLLLLVLVGSLVWTTLCLGGYLGETMVWGSRSVFLLAVVGAVRVAVGRSDAPIRIHLAALLPLPFLVFALASVWWIAPAQWLGWREWLGWLQGWIILAVVLHANWRAVQTWVLVATAAGLGMVGVALAAYQRFVDPTWIIMGRVQAEQFMERSAGMFGSPNSLAALLELMIPVCLVLLFARTVGPVAKVACGWLGAALVFALVLTGSRGGWIATGLAVLLWPLVTGTNFRRKVVGTALTGLVLLVGFVALYHFSEIARGRMTPFLDGTFELSRPLIWKAGVQIWLTAPWLGTGAASYNVLFDQYRPAGFLNEPEWTHNDYLNTLSDYGVVGFGLWAGAGSALLWLGWRAVERARRNRDGAVGVLAHWRWKFGLWLGLVAFALHLFVDFFTKLPALLAWAGVGCALLLRDEDRLWRTVRRGALLRGLAVGGMVTIVALVGWKSDRLYRAEAARYWPRRDIDRWGQKEEGDFVEMARRALPAFQRASEIDPSNGQAWADQAYATQLIWHASKGDPTILGLLARQAALRAIALCPVDAEFWVRKGSAEDMKGLRSEAGASFLRALELAPNNPEYWYYRAYHLASLTGRETAALDAVATCLSLDPSYEPALALRVRLTANEPPIQPGNNP